MQIKSLFDVLSPMDRQACPQGKEKIIFDGHYVVREGKEVFIHRENKNAVNN